MDDGNNLIKTGVNVGEVRLRRKQTMIDRLRDECWQMDKQGIPRGGQVLWVTPDDADVLVHELADIEPLTDDGQAKAKMMRDFAANGRGAELIDGERITLYGRTVKIQRIQLLS